MMMTNHGIRVRIVRPCCVNAQPLPAGQTLELAATVAADVIRAGKAELADEADHDRLVTAVRHDELKLAKGGPGYLPSTYRPPY